MIHCLPALIRKASFPSSSTSLSLFSFPAFEESTDDSILSVLCLGLFLEAGAQEGRLLKFTEPEQQVDTVRFDSGTVTLYYPFKNVSGKDVIILEVHSGCGCFTGETDKRTLAPGASAVLKASFNPATLHGAQNRHLTLVATDGTDTVFSSVSASPRIWDGACGPTYR